MVESPCIRQCCLDDHDICCGCYRHITEITGWQKLTIDEKEKVLGRCETRKNNHTFKGEYNLNSDNKGE